MMARRLMLAKGLLNPQTGVLVVAIDDNELNTLGLLLQEIFPTYKQFCLTVVHNPNGNQGKIFGVANEFAYFVVPSGDQIFTHIVYKMTYRVSIKICDRLQIRQILPQQIRNGDP